MSNARLFLAIALVLGGQRLTVKAQSSPSFPWSHFTLAQGGPPFGGPQGLVYDPGSNRLIVFGGIATGPSALARSFHTLLAKSDPAPR
jgi:hypothetical protein